MILDRLRRETRPVHERLERELPLASPDLNLSRYQQLLERFYGFYAPLERLLTATIPQDSAVQWPTRRKAPSLAADLLALGIAPESVPECRDLPPCRSLADAFGCLYVMEGATLGGQIISRSLSQQMGLHSGNGARFFNGYGTQTGERWKSFGAALTAFVAEGGAEEDIIGAAQSTFLCLERWLTAVEVHA